MKLPRSISKLIEQFEALPGIGPKTAQRLVFHLLRVPEEDVRKFAETLGQLKGDIQFCSICKNVSESEVCQVCEDANRNQRKILVVSGPLDAFAVERTGFDGVYHVLHGVIDPLNNIGPDELFINDLIKRIRGLINVTEPIEIILATNTTMEGESTAMYLYKLLRENGFDSATVKMTRIARGLPVGGDIEYTDDITLSRALDGRSEY